uniref:Thioredoxin domain-containing protein n=1 Tax=Fibrocapsa japonica TaxID=94617 RepID=A0A7S2UTJ6_9STRA|mmetsp:Transcript_12742/g.18797  ORF Transcript_12742/g.18797 Transcript_12742/m.18797 type:complete len:170 (+) Transcript_12742:270-779(+)
MVTTKNFRINKIFFEAAKKSSQMVVHFYRPSTRHCATLDEHLGKLAPRHVETRFVKIDAEKSQFLCERLNIFMMPTLLLVKDGQSFHQIRGFDELGGTDQFPTKMLAWVLSQHNIISYDGGPPEDLNFEGSGAGPTLFSRRAKRGGTNSIRVGLQEQDGDVSDGDDDEY